MISSDLQDLKSMSAKKPQTNKQKLNKKQKQKPKAFHLAQSDGYQLSFNKRPVSSSIIKYSNKLNFCVQF